jgi:hypothetical protein
MEIVYATNLLGFLLGAVKDRQQHGRKDGDYGDDYQQFDERKRASGPSRLIGASAGANTIFLLKPHLHPVYHNFRFYSKTLECLVRSFLPAIFK